MAIQDYCIGLRGAVSAIHRVTRALSGNVNSTTISDAVEEVAIAIENGGGGGGGGTTDHTKLQNRDSADQHPIGAITGLETELNGKANASSTYTKSEIDSLLATKQEELQSGTNIKTINNASLLGSGNIDIQGGGIDFEVGVEKPYGTYTDGGTTYQVYSKVIYISALPSASGITNYPHGVTNIKQVLAMYGICTNGMVMNTPRQTTSDNIGIYQVQKSGNFAIEVGKDRSSIGAYVTMIYAKNN